MNYGGNERQIRLEEYVCRRSKLIFAVGLFNMFISHVNAKQFGIDENTFEVWFSMGATSRKKKKYTWEYSMEKIVSWWKMELHTLNYDGKQRNESYGTLFISVYWHVNCVNTLISISQRKTAEKCDRAHWNNFHLNYVQIKRTQSTFQLWNI